MALCFFKLTATTVTSTINNNTAANTYTQLVGSYGHQPDLLLVGGGGKVRVIIVLQKNLEIEIFWGQEVLKLHF